VEIGFTTFVELNPAVVDLRQDCVGDGDDETIDLILGSRATGAPWEGPPTRSRCASRLARSS
jgi:hypothetical protein